MYKVLKYYNQSKNGQEWIEMGKRVNWVSRTESGLVKSVQVNSLAERAMDKPQTWQRVWVAKNKLSQVDTDACKWACRELAMTIVVKGHK